MTEFVIIRKSTQEVVGEVTEKVSKLVNRENYDVMPVVEYLRKLNLELSNGITYKHKIEKV